MAAAPIVVSPPSDKPRTRKEHWNNDKGTSFVNPWPSFHDVAASEMLKFGYEALTRGSHEDKEDRANIASLVPTVKPTWGSPADRHKMKATWLGHAAYLVEMPALQVPGGDEKAEARGLRILFDPAFSFRCSPTQWAGPPGRYQPLVCEVKDLPEVDVIVISHNHYDHQDNNTLTELYNLHSKRPPAIFVPLNNTRSLPTNIPKDQIVELDWWEDRTVEVEGRGKVKITCTPSQHFSARMPWDRNYSLWSSWAVRHVPQNPSEGAPSVWFGGDTGYCYRPATEDQHRPPQPDTPVCPAFKEIGERLGPFSLGLIPIGAYSPKSAMSPIHCDPFEAIRIFKDVKAKTAVGIHWGVWRMAKDRVAEPLGLLEEARKQMGVEEKEFGVCAMGETRAYEP